MAALLAALVAALVAAAGGLVESPLQVVNGGEFAGCASTKLGGTLRAWPRPPPFPHSACIERQTHWWRGLLRYPILRCDAA